MSDFKKKIVFTPAFDKRSSDPKKNYGIGCVDMSFYLIGDKGAVQFRTKTHWYLPEVEIEFDNKLDSCRYEHMHYKPYPYDIGYHSPHPMYEGQEKMPRCDFFPDGCYYGGSGSNAAIYFNILRRKGSKGLWRALKEYYKKMFEEHDSLAVKDTPFGELINAISPKDSAL